MRNLVWACFALSSLTVNAQDHIAGKLSQDTVDLPYKSVDRLSATYGSISSTIQQQTSHTLDRFRRQETKLRQKLMLKDSMAGKRLFVGVTQQYAQIQARLKSSVDLSVKNPLQEYFPSVDSLQTALRFLQQPGLTNLPIDKLDRLKGLSGQLTSVETRLQQANEVKAFIQSRRDQWQNLLSRYNLAGQLSSLNKQLYYYQQSITEYKTLLQNKEQLATKVVAVAMRLPTFAGFMQKNSYLSHLFCLPGNTAALPESTGLPGLQTREQVSTMVAEKLGPGVSFPAAVTNGDNGSGNPIGASMQVAQTQLAQWKGKVSQLAGEGGNSNTEVPDFQANSQKGRMILRRLEYGCSIQSQQSNYFLPATTNIGLTLAYKLSDRSVVGARMAYLLGWGQPFTHIHLSGQGMGLGGYVEIAFKKGFWFTGEYDENYLPALAEVTIPRVLSTWQPVALLGLTKKYKMGTRQGNIQLLYDALHTQHLPQSPSFVFRVGYAL